MTRPVCNWVKAMSLLAKHEKSEWHLAEEKRALSQLIEKHGAVVEQIVSVGEEERRQHMELMI